MHVFTPAGLEYRYPRSRFGQTKKFRDVARSGRAEAIAGPEPLIRLHPDRVISWGLAG